LAPHDIEPRIAGKLALIFDQYEAISFGYDDDGPRQANAGNAGQMRQFASQFGLGGEQVGQVLIEGLQLVRDELLLGS